MLKYLVLFVLASAFSFLLTPLVRFISGRLGAVDIPGDRKVHDRPIPRLGGFSIFVVFNFVLVVSSRFDFFYFPVDFLKEINFGWLFVGSAVVLGLCALDDFRRMSPHPTFFVKREIYEKYGLFNTDFRIAADYELMLRFLEKHGISTYYIPEVLIKMRLGGASNRSLKNMWIKSSEDYKAWKVNNLNGGLYTILLKNFSKIPQFFIR